MLVKQIRKSGNSRVRIGCLPIAGNNNPYQQLMMQGLRTEANFEVIHGADGRFLAVIRTWMSLRPDVIHFDWNYRYFLSRSLLLSIFGAIIFLLELIVVRYVFGCRIVWTLHNIESHEGNYRKLERLVQYLFAFICDWIRLFSTSSIDKAAAYLLKQRDKFRVVPEGSYVDYYPNVIGRTESREKLNLKADEFVMLYLGAVRPYKGIDELIRTFAMNINAKWRLLIAGSPQVESYAKDIEALAVNDKRVTLYLQFIAADQIQLFFNACDVVILPFRNIENSGSVILAMSFGKPIIAPRIGVLSERLRNQAHLLYAACDLLNAIEKASQFTNEQLQRIGAENLRLVQLNKWEDFCSCFREYFEDN